MKHSIRFWLDCGRSISLPQSALPCLTAIVLCIGQADFVWWLVFPVLLGVCAAHLGMNLTDDYFDYRHDSRIRADLSTNSIRSRTEKCHYLRSGKASIADLRRAVAGFLGFAAVMGLIAVVAQWLLHVWQAATGIVLYALSGLFFGINYSGKPLELGFHGLGELVIGLMFGPLNMLGVQAAMTGCVFSMPMLCMSAGVGCLVTNIVYVHSVVEVNADAELGKMTFARLLRKRTLMICFVAVFALLPFVMLGAGIALGWWSGWYLLTLLTLPMSVYLIYSVHHFVYGKPWSDSPHWWMGPMGDWDKYMEAGIDWFLIRWLLARNICTFFCLILIAVHIVLLFV